MPFDSNPEFARLLGLILERWTLMEAELSRSLACLLDGNIEGARAILYSLNATSVRIGVVRAVTRELVPEGPEKRGFIWLLDKINDLQKDRNEFIHGEYWQGPGGGALDLLLIRPLNAEPFRLESVTADDLQAHVAALDLRTAELTLANAEEPQYHVPRLLALRETRLRRYRESYRHAPATASNHGGP